MLERYPFHDRLKAKQPAFGMILNFVAPPMVEFAALMGFDFMMLDAEHGPFSPISMEPLIRAAELARIAPIVRLPTKNLEALRYLDMGVTGLIFPNIETAADARMAVDSTYFPPFGKRGLAPNTSASGYGFRMPYKDYIGHANELLMAIMLVETRTGVDNIDAIVKVDGVSAIIIGPMDLSSSYGTPADANSREVIQATQHIVDRCKAANKPFILAARSVDQGKEGIAAGAGMIVTPAPGMLVSLGRDFINGIKGVQ